MNEQDIITDYKLIDTILHPPQPTIQTAKLTAWEANTKNRAYRMNGTTLKYIKLEDVTSQKNIPVD